MVKQGPNLNAHTGEWKDPKARIVVQFPPGNMHYMGIHPYSFRSGVRADVIGIASVTENLFKAGKLCYIIRFAEDGREDYAPIDDAASYDVWFTQQEQGNVSIKLEVLHWGLLERAKVAPLTKSKDIGTAPLHALESVHYLKVWKKGGKQFYSITEKGIAALNARSRGVGE